MMATGDTIIKGRDPDMTEDAFVAELRRIGSPVPEADGRGVYYACVKPNRRLLPSALLGIFAAESGCGTNPDAICVGGGGVPEPTYSWGNTTEDNGKPSFGGTGRVVRGRFSVYDGWGMGGVSTVRRLFEYEPYVNLRTVREIIPVFAPKSENDTERYIERVEATIARLGKGGTVARHIAIAAGHHHTNDYQGGRVLSNRAEFDFVGPLAGAIADELRRYPEHFRVTQLTPNNGLGIYPGGLWDVAAAGAALVPDMLIELHTQGLNDAGQRGAFLIYPDWTVGGVHDKDTDAIAFAGVLLPALAEHAGIPRWRDGLMSETRTNVAIVEKARLGFFNKSNTPAAREKTTRFLVEHLHHSNPAELARMRGEADLPQRIGRAYAVALASYYGLALPAAPDAGKAPVAPPEDPNALRLEVPGRGEFWIVEPILTYWENCGRVYDNPNALGWPVTGMVEEDGALIQYFDRGRVEVRGTQITSGLVGLEAARAAGKAA